MCRVALNQELNGIELFFDKKPERATLDAIKAQGFRWNRKKCVWYAKQTAERLTFAQTLGQIAEDATQTQDSLKAATNKINMNGVNHKPLTAHGADLAKIIREELKMRGVSGVTVRARRVTYDTGITVTIKATESDFASVEEYKKRYTMSCFECDIMTHGLYTGESWTYSLEGLTEDERERLYNSFVRYQIAHRHDFNQYHRERDEYPQFTTAFCEKVNNIYLIANQWNYDNSDSMSDYFDVGYYLDIDIKCGDFEPRETMTDAERVGYDLEQQKKAEEEAAYFAKMEQERKEAEEAHKKAEAARKEAESMIYNDIRVEDLSETEQIFVKGLTGGCGKDSTIEELKEESREVTQGALITRKVIFSDVAIFETFGNYLLNDWVFVAGKGGTACEDLRLDALDLGGRSIFNVLTDKQRESLEYFKNDCIGVYVGDVLKLVIDPQGYNYCRYTYIVNDDATITSGAEELERMRKESEAKPAFYIPAPIAEQVANIEAGQKITIYQCDGWMLTSIFAGCGTVADVRAGSYAQYTGFYIDFVGGKSVFIHDGRDCLIYEGLQTIPQEITREKVSDNMYKIYTVFDGLFDKVYTYFTGQGLTPLLDTIAK